MIPRIRMVQVKNYKSLADVSVELGPFTVLVGPNGSGKSNFVDALSFVQECLNESVELAFRRRGGMYKVFYRGDRRERIGLPGSGVSPEEWRDMIEKRADDTAGFGFRFFLDLADDVSADYSFVLGMTDVGIPLITQERCVVDGPQGERHEFEVRYGNFVKTIEGIAPRLSPDRLTLFAASATAQFRPVFDFLSDMRVYSIVPAEIRGLQEPDQGIYLKRDGSNAAAVLKRLLNEHRGQEDARTLVRLVRELAAGVEDLTVQHIGVHETIFLRQDIGLEEPEGFPAQSMSDGTLRCLGILLALYQRGQPRVLGIEEPEATVHPALADMLMEVLISASQDRQVLITTHSPDLLNYKELRDDQIRLVTLSKGKTVIVPPSGPLRDVIREHLCLTGELLSMGELHPHEETLSKYVTTVDLFGPPLPEARNPQ
jgi:predicted ATPase